MPTASKPRTEKPASQPEFIPPVKPVHPEDTGVDENLVPPSLNKEQLRSLPFWQLLASMSEADWDMYMAYLYRSKGSGVIKTDPKDDWYIAKIPHAFDEEWVKENYGGGGFTVLLNHMPSRKAVRKHTFHIAGSPKLQPGEIATKQQGADGTTAAQPAAGGDMAQLLKLLEKMMTQESTKEKDAVTRSLDIVSKGAETAMAIRDKAANSTTGNAIGDKLVEAVITKMATNQSPFEDIVKVFGLLKTLMPPAQGGQGLTGVIGEIKGVLGLAKDMGFKIGGGGGAEGGGEGAMDWKAALAMNASNMLGMVMQFIDNWRQQSDEARLKLARMEEALRARGVVISQDQTPAPPAQQTARYFTPPNPAPPAAPNPQPGATTQQPPAEQQQQLTINFGYVAALIRRCFDKGDTGDAAAFLLRRVYDDNAIAPYLSYLTDEAQLNQLCQMTPTLAEIMTDDNFPVFRAEFIRGMRAKDEELEEEVEAEDGEKNPPPSTPLQ